MVCATTFSHMSNKRLLCPGCCANQLPPKRPCRNQGKSGPGSLGSPGWAIHVCPVVAEDTDQFQLPLEQEDSLHASWLRVSSEVCSPGTLLTSSFLLLCHGYLLHLCVSLSLSVSQVNVLPLSLPTITSHSACLCGLFVAVVWVFFLILCLLLHLFLPPITSFLCIMQNMFIWFIYCKHLSSLAVRLITCRNVN